MGISLQAGDALTAAPVPEQCALALAFISRRALDPDDAALLAEACGLRPYRGHATTRIGKSQPVAVERSVTA